MKEPDPSDMTESEAVELLGNCSEDRLDVPRRVKKIFRKEKSELALDPNVEADSLSDGLALAILCERAVKHREFREDPSIRAELKD